MDFFLRSFSDQIYAVYIDNGDNNGFVNYTDRLMVDTDGDTVGDTNMFRDKYLWLNHFSDQGFNVTIEDIPISPTNTYSIQVAIAPNTETYVGNFLWSNDDYFSPEGTEPSDMYIGHSNLTLLSVDWNDEDPNYNFSASDGYKHVDLTEANTTDDQGNVVFEGQTLPYVHYQLDRESMRPEGTVYVSEMVIPVGAWVTMKIEPHYGYQVKAFELSGADAMEVGDVSVFSFQIGPGNVHIGAQVLPVEDDAVVQSDAVSEAGVQLADGTLTTGSARLYVEDATLSASKEADFEEQAANEGLEIQSVLDVDLSQVFFKGSGDDSDVWDIPMHTLNEEATIGMKLEGVAAGSEVEFIHNISDGDEFETIPATYDKTTGMYVAKVGGFSNFAVAVKKGENAATTTASTTDKTTAAAVTTSPRTGDDASPLQALILLGLAGAAMVLMTRKGKA